jgi:hypothetical protein
MCNTKCGSVVSPAPYTHINYERIIILAIVEASITSIICHCDTTQLVRVTTGRLERAVWTQGGSVPTVLQTHHIINEPASMSDPSSSSSQRPCLLLSVVVASFHVLIVYSVYRHSCSRVFLTGRSMSCLCVHNMPRMSRLGHTRGFTLSSAP